VASKKKQKMNVQKMIVGEPYERDGVYYIKRPYGILKGLLFGDRERKKKAFNRKN